MTQHQESIPKDRQPQQDPKAQKERIGWEDQKQEEEERLQLWKERNLHDANKKQLDQR